MPNGGREPNGWPEPDRRSGMDRRAPPSAGFFGNMTLSSTWPIIVTAVVLIVWAVGNANTSTRTSVDLADFRKDVTSQLKEQSGTLATIQSQLNQKFPAIEAEQKSQGDRVTRLEKEAEQTGDDADKLERRVWTAEQWIAGVDAASRPAMPTQPTTRRQAPGR
jgi:hypothetical protein